MYISDYLGEMIISVGNMKFDKSDKYYLQDIVAENVVACIVMPEE